MDANYRVPCSSQKQPANGHIEMQMGLKSHNAARIKIRNTESYNTTVLKGINNAVHVQEINSTHL